MSRDFKQSNIDLNTLFIQKAGMIFLERSKSMENIPMAFINVAYEEDESCPLLKDDAEVSSVMPNCFDKNGQRINKDRLKSFRRDTKRVALEFNKLNTQLLLLVDSAMKHPDAINKKPDYLQHRRNAVWEECPQEKEGLIRVLEEFCRLKFLRLYNLI